jgi:uncharacterized protein YraI
MKRLFTFFTILFFTLTAFGQNVVTTSAVRFRLTPDMENNIICIIPKGTELSVISGTLSCRGWLAIRYNGKIGWVYQAYVKQKTGKTRDNNSDDYLPPLSENFPI